MRTQKSRRPKNCIKLVLSEAGTPSEPPTNQEIKITNKAIKLS